MRRLTMTALMAVALVAGLAGCRPASTEGSSKVTIHYVEIITNDVDTLAGLYQRLHGVTFGTPDADLGNARVAESPDGTLIGIRKPLAAHEQPMVRTYFAVKDIERAAKDAAANGATVAYPPTRQGKRGTFAIVIQGGVEHGLWQR